MKTGLFALVTLLAAACGGPGVVNPRPLKYHLEAQHLDSVDPAKQSDVLAAKGEHEMATLQRNKVKSDLGELDLKVLQAKNEAKAAALAMESAKAQEKAAAATADTAKKSEAAAAVKRATLEREVADARMAYVSGQQKAQQKELRAAEFQVYATESKLELAKAAVAVNNSIAPSGFKYGDYEAQQKQRAAEAVKARTEADIEAAKTAGLQKTLTEKEDALRAASL